MTNELRGLSTNIFAPPPLLAAATLTLALAAFTTAGAAVVGVGHSWLTDAEQRFGLIRLDPVPGAAGARVPDGRRAHRLAPVALGRVLGAR